MLTTLQTLIAPLLTIIALIVGYGAWKRQLLGSVEIELARKVLTKFYEAQDAISAIRSPFSYSSEGSTREPSEDETPEDKEIYDRAFVTLERINQRVELFSELRALKYEYCATFGREASRPFEELDRILSDIQVSAQMLGRNYWKDVSKKPWPPEKFGKHYQKCEELENKIWYSGTDDEIDRRMQNAVERVEKLLERRTNRGRNWVSRTSQWFRSNYEFMSQKKMPKE